MTNQEIYEAIARKEKVSGIHIDDDVLDIIESVVGKRKSKLSVKLVVPETGETEVSGKVIEFNHPINIYTRLGYDPRSDLSVKLLGTISFNMGLCSD